MVRRIHSARRRRSALLSAWFSCFWRIGLSGALASSIFILGWSSPSSASTALGYITSSGIGCPTVDLIEFSPPSAGSSYTAPTDGFLSSWSTEAGTSGDASVSLEIWRPTSGADTLVYRSAGATTTAGVSNTRTLSPTVSVLAGDIIGLGSNNGTGTFNVTGCIEAPQSGTSAWGYVYGPTTVGATIGSSSFTTSTAYEINVSAQFSSTANSPVVSGLAPTSGAVLGGTSVTISGTNLDSAAAVKFGTLSATITADTATSITATSPAALTAGVVDVTVTTASGTSTISGADHFTYQKANQSVSFTSGVPVAVIGSTYGASASATSGLTPVLTVDASTTNSACSLSGSTVTFAHGGNCVLDADQAGSALYNAATEAQQSITVPKTASTITWSPPAAGTASLAGNTFPAQSSGVTLTTGQSAVVTITGSGSVGTGFPSTGPDGDTTSSLGCALVPAAHPGEIVGTLDGGTTYFTLGSGPTTVTGPGTLSVIQNDCLPGGDWGDNTGSYNITVTPAITYGTALTSQVLDASASVAGTFIYSPPLGTVLSAGSHTLGVSFSPTSATDFTAPSASTAIHILPAPLSITASSTSVGYGSAPPTIQPGYSGFVNSDSVFSLPSAPSCSTTATSSSTIGHYASICAGAVDPNYAISYPAGQVTVTQATPQVTWTTPAAITFGTTLSSAQLNATSPVPGTFTYSPPAGTRPAAGNDNLGVTFTPTDTTDYATTRRQVTLSVGQASTGLAWTTPVAITYGSALGASQLDASASVPGTFAYSPATGAVLGAGSHTLSVTFNPTDTTDYPVATSTVRLEVDPSSPQLTWATPAAITYGATLGTSQLAASASVPGTFTYSPAAGSTPAAGTDTLSVSFTPTDSTDYASATKSVSLDVAKATPQLTWATPAAITYGTQLGTSQLAASASVPGTFTYSPVAGSTPPAGTHTLSVSFTPTDSTDYASATKSVSLSVAKATPQLTWAAPAAMTYGDQLGSSQLNATSSVSGTFSYSPPAGTNPAAGVSNLTVTFTPDQAPNVTSATKSVGLTVNKATPQLTWAAPAAMTYGTVLGTTQLNASSSVSGTFSYTPAAGALPVVGSDPLKASFTPADAHDYTGATSATTLTVTQAMPVLTWQTPAAITEGTALSSTQLGATASVPGTFVYSPAAGATPSAGTDNLSVTFAPQDTADYQSATGGVSLEVDASSGTGDTTPTTTALPDASTTTLPPAPSGTVDININGEPGLSVSAGHVHVQGHGFRPESIVTIVAHSSPVEIGSATVGANGRFNTTVSMPRGLSVGAHHIVVSGVMQNGTVVAQTEAFTVASGGVLGVVGSLPPGPLSNAVGFVPTSHPGSVLTTTAGATAAIAAIGSALGGGMTGGGGGGKGGGSGGGSDGSGGGGYLEDVEFERRDLELRGGSRGDRSSTWRWPGTSRLDHFSKHFPRRVAGVSPVAGRVLIDGDYLRAMFGTGWLVLCAIAFGLGLYASASTGWYAIPPALGIFLAVLGISVFDSTLGYLAGIGFFTSALFAGHIATTGEIRTAAGIVLIWFAVPLAAAAIRPLRRNLELNLVGLWERAGDVVIAGLFGAWAAQKMTGALSGLAGVELPLDKSVNTVGFAVLAFITARIIIETIAAHHYPRRIEQVLHQGELESENIQVGLSLVIQIVLFLFVAVSFMGRTWALYVGTAVFFMPLVPWLFANKLPKSKFVTKWKPKGLVNWTLIIVIGVLLSKLLGALIHEDKLLEQIGFILLPLPILISWGLELFEDEGEQDEEEELTGATEMTASIGEAKELADERAPELALATSSAHATSADGSHAGDGHGHHESEDHLGVTGFLEAEGSRSRFREAEREREVEREEEELVSSPTAWLRRLAGVPLVVIAVYLVVTHIAGG